MIQISNRQFDIICDKLPRVLQMAQGATSLTLRQSEDIRLLRQTLRQLTKKRTSATSPHASATSPHASATIPIPVTPATVSVASATAAITPTITHYKI